MKLFNAIAAAASSVALFGSALTLITPAPAEARNNGWKYVGQSAGTQPFDGYIKIVKRDGHLVTGVRRDVDQDGRTDVFVHVTDCRTWQNKLMGMEDGKESWTGWMENMPGTMGDAYNEALCN